VTYYPCNQSLTSRSHAHRYLAHKKQRPPRILQQDYAQGPMVVLRSGVVSYERGTPVTISAPRQTAANEQEAHQPMLLPPVHTSHQHNQNASHYCRWGFLFQGQEKSLSEVGGNNSPGSHSHNLTLTVLDVPRPESGPYCLRCAQFAR